MNTQNTTPRPVNEKALRRWINECYEGAASCSTWTLQECEEFVTEHHVQGLDAFRQSPYREWPPYQNSRPGVRATVDAVFEAIQNSASPLVGLDLTSATGTVGCSFTWYDGSKYRVEILDDGRLHRLYRYEYTGRWVKDEESGEMWEDATWRTVRAMSKDRAGRLLGNALKDYPAALPWDRAAAL